MQLSKGKVMIVEDDLEYLALYKEILNTQFDVYTFTCAREALQATEKLKPQTIILDLHLPDITGIEFCEELHKKNFEQSKFEIIFISGETDISQKLKAFEMGAADFLTKPFEIDELKHKIGTSIGRQLNREQLQESINSNNRAYNKRIEQVSQCNQIMHFYNDITLCSTVHGIADAFFSLMSSFGLQTSICFRLPKPTCLRDDRIRTTPIEEEIFEILKHAGHIHEFSNRVLINQDNVSFLIKHTPDNSHNFELVKQNACGLAEAMNAKALELCQPSKNESPIYTLPQKLEALRLEVNDYQNDTNRLLTIMMYEITANFQSLNITDQQKQWLTELTKHTLSRIDEASQRLTSSAASLSTEINKTESSQVRPFSEPKSKP
ncbi:response regulator [Pseudoalteromonas umbrosa]|uniref:response regulator n=1 Tax=Pseudoalteromonas umbrosa TaxID=3048489 RepID=UPI0024C27ACC|nr:response regulator [Pseudoalteromonas sp. B95]MDK1286475.1 response regulator [Pseudoalteromonas sp. B95]